MKEKLNDFTMSLIKSSLWNWLQGFPCKNIISSSYIHHASLALLSFMSLMKKKPQMKYQNADKKLRNYLTLESSSLKMAINANEAIY